MTLKITTNADKVASLFTKLRNDINKELIPHGLDPILNESITKLKEDLLFFINNQVRFENKTKSSNTLNENSVNTAESDKTILKEFGYDLNKVKLNSYETDSFESKIKFIQNYKKNPSDPDNLHCRVQVPCSSEETIEQIYNKALKNFQDSVYVNNNGYRPKYFILNEAGKQALRDYVKIFCSTFTGIEDGPALLKALKRRKLEVQKGKDYSFWAIKQNGLEKLLDPTNGWSIEITDVITDIKEGNINRASEKLNSSNLQVPEHIKEKVEDIKDNKDINPDTKNYLNLVNLINSLKLSKKLDEYSSTYTLIGDIDGIESEETNDILEQIKSKISLWKITNEKNWINEVIQLITKIIQKHLSV